MVVLLENMIKHIMNKVKGRQSGVSIVYLEKWALTALH